MIKQGRDLLSRFGCWNHCEVFYSKKYYHINFQIKNILFKRCLKRKTYGCAIVGSKDFDKIVQQKPIKFQFLIFFKALHVHYLIQIL